MKKAQEREKKLVQDEMDEMFEILSRQSLIRLHLAHSSNIPENEIEIAEIAFKKGNHVLVVCCDQDTQDHDRELIDRWLFLVQRYSHLDESLAFKKC